MSTSEPTSPSVATSATSATSATGPVLEVAVYTVRDPDSFSPVHRDIHRLLTARPGHLAGLGLRAAGADPALAADVIAWASADDAHRASAAVEQDPAFAPLRGAIERVRLFAHYTVAGAPAELVAALARAPVVELAAYTVRDAAAQAEAHPRLHARLRAQDGFRAGAPGRHVAAAARFLDAVGWASAAAQHRAGEVIPAEPAFAGVFADARLHRGWLGRSGELQVHRRARAPRARGRAGAVPLARRGVRGARAIAVPRAPDARGPGSGRAPRGAVERRRAPARAAPRRDLSRPAPRGSGGGPARAIAA